MTKPIRILLQTTIPFAEDNWHIGRFSLLRDELSSMKDRDRILEEKFQEAMKRAEKDKDKPYRNPLDID